MPTCNSTVKPRPTGVRNTCRRDYLPIVNLVKCRSICDGIKGDLCVLVVKVDEIVLYAIFTFIVGK